METLDSKHKKTTKEFHNLSKNSRLYSRWAGMKGRCYDKNHRAYKNYGEKGITVCDEWLHSFKAFYDWAVANGWSEDRDSYQFQLDRIDNNKGYSPDNCRFVNSTTQKQNTRLLRSTNTTGYRGVAKKGNKFRAHITVNYKYVSLGSYITAEEAAKAFNAYVVVNGLEQPLNNVGTTNPISLRTPTIAVTHITKKKHKAVVKNKGVLGGHAEKNRVAAATFAEKASIVHDGKYTYNKTEYVKSHLKIIVTCKEHGDFEITPNNHLRGKGCAKCAIERRSKSKD